VRATSVVNRSMTTMIIVERVAGRSVISVKLIIAGMSLNKGHTVMLFQSAWRTTDRNGG
jgi:hypothetical protein